MKNLFTAIFVGVAIQIILAIVKYFYRENVWIISYIYPIIIEFITLLMITTYLALVGKKIDDWFKAIQNMENKSDKTIEHQSQLISELQTQNKSLHDTLDKKDELLLEYQIKLSGILQSGKGSSGQDVKNLAEQKIEEIPINK